MKLPLLLMGGGGGWLYPSNSSRGKAILNLLVTVVTWSIFSLTEITASLVHVYTLISDSEVYSSIYISADIILNSSDVDPDWLYVDSDPQNIFISVRLNYRSGYHRYQQAGAPSYFLPSIFFPAPLWIIIIELSDHEVT